MKGNYTTSKTRTMKVPLRWQLLGLTLLLFTAGALFAQTPVDDEGNPIGPVYSGDGEIAADDADVVLLGTAELEDLVGPIALYPDDLLAIVLPASTYPLQIVQAARYLEQLESDSSVQPDESWDDAVVALLNYPEALRMMSDDIDWTWRLGEAVVAQQNDVVAAVESFRDRAYAAGNLKSDERQTVTRNEEDVIVIDPVEDDVIYVPYYEPERVVVYQPRPVYHYYPRAYPVYYYPYPAGHHFRSGFFWGVTTAFRVGWSSDHLHVYHHSYHGHPYFGWNYYGNHWRRPSVYVFNNWYGNWGYRNARDRYRYGSYWRPRRHGGARPGAHPARDRYYDGRRRSHSDDGYADRDRRRDERRRFNDSDSDFATARNRVATNQSNFERRNRQQRRTDNQDAGAAATSRNRTGDRDAIRFRSRNSSARNRTGERRTVAGEREQERAAINFRTRAEGTARTAERRTPRSEQRRTNPRPAAVRNRNAREDIQRRNNARQAPARRAPDARRDSRTALPATASRRNNPNVRRSPQVREASRARTPERVARRNDANVRRTPARSAPPRRAEARPQRAPAPRASSPARRSAPAVRQRPVQRPAANSSRARAAAPSRQAAPAQRSKRSERRNSERRQRR